ANQPGLVRRGQGMRTVDGPIKRLAHGQPGGSQLSGKSLLGQGLRPRRSIVVIPAAIFKRGCRKQVARRLYRSARLGGFVEGRGNRSQTRSMRSHDAIKQHFGPDQVLMVGGTRVVCFMCRQVDETDAGVMPDSLRPALVNRQAAQPMAVLPDQPTPDRQRRMRRGQVAQQEGKTGFRKNRGGGRGGTWRRDDCCYGRAHKLTFSPRAIVGSTPQTPQCALMDYPSPLPDDLG